MRAYRVVRLATIVFWVLLWMNPEATLLAQPAVTAPAGVHIIDTPNDGGGSLTVVWAPSPSDSADGQYQVLIGGPGANDPASLKVIAEFPANTRYVRDAKGAWWTRAADPTWHQYVIRNGKGVELKDGTAYPVTVAMRKGDERAARTPAQANPSRQLVQLEPAQQLDSCPRVRRARLLHDQPRETEQHLFASHSRPGRRG